VEWPREGYPQSAIFEWAKMAVDRTD
jgi:hypothetical protein